MYYTYILRSHDDKHRYVGHCEYLNTRLKQHNSGKVKSTKPFSPWKFVHTQEFKTRLEAIKREKYLKSGAGREWMDLMDF
jgi:putative endonuclease